MCCNGAWGSAHYGNALWVGGRLTLFILIRRVHGFDVLRNATGGEHRVLDKRLLGFFIERLPAALDEPHKGLITWLRCLLCNFLQSVDTAVCVCVCLFLRLCLCKVFWAQPPPVASYQLFSVFLLFFFFRARLNRTAEAQPQWLAG